MRSRIVPQELADQLHAPSSAPVNDTDHVGSGATAVRPDPGRYRSRARFEARFSQQRIARASSCRRRLPPTTRMLLPLIDTPRQHIALLASLIIPAATYSSRCKIRARRQADGNGDATHGWRQESGEPLPGRQICRLSDAFSIGRPSISETRFTMRRAACSVSDPASRRGDCRRSLPRSSRPRSPRYRCSRMSLGLADSRAIGVFKVI